MSLTFDQGRYVWGCKDVMQLTAHHPRLLKAPRFMKCEKVDDLGVRVKWWPIKCNRHTNHVRTYIVFAYLYIIYTLYIDFLMWIVKNQLPHPNIIISIAGMGVKGIKQRFTRPPSVNKRAYDAI